MRRAEIIASLSLATDLAIGQPLEFAFKSCVLSMRLGSVLQRPPEEIREIYHQALLRYIGCNADTYILAALFGDETEMRRDFARVDMGNDLEVMQVVVRAMRRTAQGQSTAATIGAILKGLVHARSTSVPVLNGHCEVAERIAHRLGLDPVTIRNLGQLYERWDGKGLPKGLQGEAVAPAVRIVNLAQDALVLRESFGDAETRAIISKRRGKAYDPRMADALVQSWETLWVSLDRSATLDGVLALEPAPQRKLDEPEIDEACLVIADVVDMRSPFTVGHSRAVSALAEAAGRQMGLPVSTQTTLRRAGWLHDFGEVSVPTATMLKAGQLTDSEQEKIRLHPYFTERLLKPVADLGDCAVLAGQHHECNDGSGYHRGTRGAALSPASRILAAAEAYRTKLEARPHRPALTPDAAAAYLRGEVREGRLDSAAVAAVLASAGHQSRGTRMPQIADLTPREIEILSLIARGNSTKAIARRAGIAPKTADNHIQSIYAKIGVSTRAAAVLFAVEHGLHRET